MVNRREIFGGRDTRRKARPLARPERDVAARALRRHCLTAPSPFVQYSSTSHPLHRLRVKASASGVLRRSVSGRGCVHGAPIGKGHDEESLCDEEAESR